MKPGRVLVEQLWIAGAHFSANSIRAHHPRLVFYHLSRLKEENPGLQTRPTRGLGQGRIKEQAAEFLDGVAIDSSVSRRQGYEWARRMEKSSVRLTDNDLHIGIIV